MISLRADGSAAERDARAAGRPGRAASFSRKLPFRVEDAFPTTSVAALSPAFGLLAVPVLAVAACSTGPWPEPPPVTVEALAAEHEEWRVYRQGRLVEPPGGAVIWIGLWELREGEVQFGSDPALAVVLPEEDSPPVAGTLRRTGDEVTLEPAAADLRVRGEDGDALVTGPLTMRNDRADDPTWLVLGSLGLRIHAEMGTDRLWLRAWDEDSPKRETFRLPPFYPVEPSWRMVARMEPYAEPRTMPLADVTDGTVANVAQGELVFRIEGREHRLVAFATEKSKDYFVMLWDSTATVDTYPGGRYMKVPFPDDDGWTVIDFNRAYNPPCVFTPYSVCSLPPRESRLEAAVTAGEKAPGAEGRGETP